MMRLLTISVLLLIAGGCKVPQMSNDTNQRRLEKDSMVTKEVLRKVMVKQPGEAIRANVLIPCPEGLTPQSGAVKGQRVRLNYRLDAKGTLQIDCNADSLMLEVFAKDMVIERLRYISDSVSQVKQTVVTNSVTRYRTPFWNWMLMLGLVAALFRKPIWNQVKKRLPWT